MLCSKINGSFSPPAVRISVNFCLAKKSTMDEQIFIMAVNKNKNIER
jgi:hypothetical protein